jgi:hypothetical protein
MASGDAGRTLTTYFRSMGKGRDHAVDCSGTRFSHRAYKQPLSAKQQAEITARHELKDFAPARAAVIERWICFVLGVACIVCAAFGIFAQPMEGPPSASVAWLGSANIRRSGSPHFCAFSWNDCWCVVDGVVLTVSQKEKR